MNGSSRKREYFDSAEERDIRAMEHDRECYEANCADMGNNFGGENTWQVIVEDIPGPITRVFSCSRGRALGKENEERRRRIIFPGEKGYK